MQSIPEQIELEELVKDLQVKDSVAFTKYIEEIWRDLSHRNISDKDDSKEKKGIDKLTFTKYYDLPGIINDRLFSCFKKSSSQTLGNKEFVDGMSTLFTGNFQSLAKFIFRFYDFNKDGYIDKIDIKAVLVYVPIQKKYQKNLMKYEQQDYEDRVESQAEIESMLDKAFGKKEKLNEADFINVIDNVSSDIFIYILMFLLEKKPFLLETFNLYPKSLSPEPKKDKSHKIASPTLKSKFVSPMLKRKSIQIEKGGILNLYAMNQQNQQAKAKNEKDVFSININKGLKRRAKQNLKTLDAKESKNKNDVNASVCDVNNIPMDEDIDFDLQENLPVVTHEGYMYKLTDASKLKRVYFRLVGKDFYYYKLKGDTEHKGIHNLSGVFIKYEGTSKLSDKDYYHFSINYPNKARKYYVETEAECTQWVEKLNSAVQYEDIFSQFEFKEKAGKGKFGLVKLGIHKATKRRVAVKIMEKKGMSSQDLELAKTEIDILKVCQHPNIIKLYDVFENQRFIYIIMEYCSGGDLFTYIEKRGYKLPEKRAAEIIHKLSMAVYYLHSYNVVHRDLKPENILMTSDEENADIRLVDFGLSKIIGPTITCTEPYGTLSYVAPEVLQEKVYGKEVDLWSIGIITFLLLCGFLPYDDEISEREIARMTIEDPVPFHPQHWKKLSPESKKFVDDLLKKEPKERMTIEKVLEHDWFRKFINVSPGRLSPKKTKNNQFSLYTSNIGK